MDELIALIRVKFEQHISQFNPAYRAALRRGMKDQYINPEIDRYWTMYRDGFVAGASYIIHDALNQTVSALEQGKSLSAGPGAKPDATTE